MHGFISVVLTCSSDEGETRFVWTKTDDGKSRSWILCWKSKSYAQHATATTASTCYNLISASFNCPICVGTERNMSECRVILKLDWAAHLRFSFFLHVRVSHISLNPILLIKEHMICLSILASTVYIVDIGFINLTYYSDMLSTQIQNNGVCIAKTNNHQTSITLIEGG